MFKKNICSAVLAGAVLLSGGHAHADFNYAEHHYATYNSTPEDVSDKDAYLANDEEIQRSFPANDYILELQKVAADANGLKIGNYAKAGDYKKIVQPVRLIDLNDSFNAGNYQIVLGTKRLSDNGGYQYGQKQLRRPEMDAGIIWEIGHEMGHGVLNHGTGKHDRITAEEEDADRIAWYTLEKTSDFGWGYAFNINTAFRTDSNNEDYIKRQTNNKLWIHGWNKHNVTYELNVNGRWLNARDLYIGMITAMKPDRTLNSTYNSYAISLSQLGYIYSKEKTIDVSKIEVVDETKYDYLKSKLIYRSSNMPNGYKTIAFFSSPADTIKAIWNKSKYTANDGYGLENMGRDLLDFQQTQDNTNEEWEKALITSIKYIGIDVYNGHNHFDI